MAFNPLDPATNTRLLEQARRDAAVLGYSPSLGEDALQLVLEQLIEGDVRLILKPPGYFRVAVRHRIQDLARRNRREVSLEEVVSDSEEGLPDHDRSLLLAWFAEPEAAFAGEGEPAAARRRRRLKALIPALEELPEKQLAAVKARIRQRALRLMTEKEFMEVERELGLDLGRHKGTAELARQRGEPGGTVACRATRAMEKLEALLDDAEKSHREESRRGPGGKRGRVR